MRYRIEYSEKVRRVDAPNIPRAHRAQIEKAISERLAVAPLDFGKPLRHNLNGIRSLRVGDWRIGYCVEGETVTITHIELRRDAYKGW